MTATHRSHPTPDHLDRTEPRVRLSVEPPRQWGAGDAAASRNMRSTVTSSPARVEKEHSAGAVEASRGMSQLAGYRP